VISLFSCWVFGSNSLNSESISLGYLLGQQHKNISASKAFSAPVVLTTSYMASNAP